MSERTAQYKEQIIYDYRHNPLIEALPPIWSSDEVVDMLSHTEGQHDGERQLDAHYRFHSVLRLFQYFQPLKEHVNIEQRFSRCIRQGYLHRNPLSPEYVKSLVQGHEMIKNRKDYTFLSAFLPTAAGFTIIGLSGIGKTSAVTYILRLYPQVVEHSSYQGIPLVLKQVVWLKLDCPYDGSVKGLCMGFFEALDRAAGTEYFETYCKRGATVDVLMIRMAQAARLHCLGVLVIDEMQHLIHAKSGGSEKLLNFTVTLVNTIGVPVVLIGTSKAKSILQGDFRQARRSSGQQGDLIWDRMKNDAAWDIFVLSMWENQWTKNIVPLTDELKDALYHESQGIVDIAVKLIHCGMRYKQKKTKNTRELRVVIDYGHLWNSELIRCCQDPKTTNEQATIILKCSMKVLKGQKRQLGLSEQVHYDREMGPEAYYKAQVTALCKKYDEVTISLMKEKVPGAHSYLKRHDPEWLRKRIVFENKRKRVRECEEQFLNRVREVAAKLSNDGYPKRQVTFGYISCMTGFTLTKLRHKNPQSAIRVLLSNIIESKADWIYRRATEVCHERLTSGKPISVNAIRWELRLYPVTFAKYKGLLQKAIDTVYG